MLFGQIQVEFVRLRCTRIVDNLGWVEGGLWITFRPRTAHRTPHTAHRTPRKAKRQRNGNTEEREGTRGQRGKRWQTEATVCRTGRMVFEAAVAGVSRSGRSRNDSKAQVPPGIGSTVYWKLHRRRNLTHCKDFRADREGCRPGHVRKTQQPHNM